MDDKSCLLDASRLSERDIADAVSLARSNLRRARKLAEIPRADFAG
jgi:hypothetical protein